ncbi:39S ribosomal protein L41, mitochondrial [Trichonephila clavata]|uniref:39S ribosomal protein L41, mitochondrial n=1 Tax=Trichonephila clavata TaxID=2740835 RepID=A0A8X6JAY3_TRICU|nr:39S ribosomal protein L41, mitochondrial [Trichonephila clavata]
MISIKICQAFNSFNPQILISVHKAVYFDFIRNISSSSVLHGKRNFRKFTIPKRGNADDLKWFREHPELVDRKGQRLPGYWKDKEFVKVPEMVPELVVPDLTNFPLKPYVSYRAADTEQEKFTPEHLFYAVYAKKLEKDFKEGKLDERGNPLEPSEEEKMDADEAWRKARSAGSDLFG